MAGKYQNIKIRMKNHLILSEIQRRVVAAALVDYAKIDHWCCAREVVFPMSDVHAFGCSSNGTSSFIVYGLGTAWNRTGMASLAPACTIKGPPYKSRVR